MSNSNDIRDQAVAAGVVIPPTAADPQPAGVPSPHVGDNSSMPIPSGVEGVTADELDSAPKISRSGVIRRQLQERRAALASDRPPLFLLVPGYEDLGLTIRYRFVTPERMGRHSATLKKIKNEVKQGIEGSKLSLIEACEEFLIRVGPEVEDLSKADYEPLSTTGVPACFDKLMIQELGGDPNSIDSARDAVDWLFENHYVMIDHAKKVNDWLSESAHSTEEGATGDGFERDFV